jgi:hypothetical protein
MPMSLMLRNAFRSAALPALFLAATFAASASAQANYDIVELSDGTTLDSVRVEKFNLRELVVKERSSSRSIEREKVFRITLNTSAARRLLKDARQAASEENWAVAVQEYLKAANDAKARRSLSGFAPQFAVWEALKIARKWGTPEEIKEIEEQLTKDYRDTGFWPNLWEQRVQDAFVAGSDRDSLSKAKATVEEFKTFAKERLTKKYQVESEIFETQIRLRLKEISGAQAQTKYQQLLGQVRGQYQGLANMLNLEIANAELVQNRIKEAREVYREILKSGVADDDTMAGAYVGLGHSYMRVAERSKEDGRHALSNYMRALVLYPQSDVERLGEAAYHAIKAYQVWEPNARNEQRRLYTRLKRRYAASSWSKKDL